MSQKLSSVSYHVAGAAYSAIGGRPENQDCCGFGETPLGYLALVCDGMGGGPAGSTASSLAVNSILRSFSAFAPTIDRAEALRMAISQAETDIEVAMQKDSRLVGMGTTVVALLVNEQSAVIATLGDSRCYQFRRGKTLFRSTDQSLVGELVRAGAITEEQARTSPQANVITAALGSSSNHEPNIVERPYLAGDRFILCTDGVWGSMPHPDLLDRFCQAMPLDAIADNMCVEVDRIGLSSNGHFDNHSFAVIEVNKDSVLKEKMNKLYKIIVAALAILLLISVCLNLRNCNNKALKEQIGQLQTELDDAHQKMVNMEEEGNQRTYDHYLAYYEEKLYMQDCIDSLSDLINNMRDTLVQQKDSLAKTNTILRPQSAKIVKELIALCDDVLGLKYKKVKDATKVWSEKKQKMLFLISQLKHVTAKKHHPSIAKIDAAIKNDTLWYVDSEVKNGYHYHTNTARQKMQKLKELLEKIRTEL